jgi:hypothetical protein
MVDSVIGTTISVRVSVCFRTDEAQTTKYLITGNVPVQVRQLNALNKQNIHKKISYTYRIYLRDRILCTQTDR